MIGAAARTFRTAAQRLRAVPRRALSGSAAGHASEARKWRNISFAALPFIALFAVYNLNYESKVHPVHAAHLNMSYPYFGQERRKGPLADEAHGHH